MSAYLRGWGVGSLVLAFTVCLSGWGLALAGEDTPETQIGSAAPDFTLQDLHGKKASLSDLKGKIVVLEWINHQCPFSKGHYKLKTTQTVLKKLSEMASKKEKQVVWLAIDSSHFAQERLDEIKEWWHEQGEPAPYLLDAPGRVGKIYGAKTTPHVFVIDEKGVLVYSGAMDDDSSMSGKTSVNYVEEAVRALLSGSAVARSTTKPYGCSVKYGA